MALARTRKRLAAVVGLAATMAVGGAVLASPASAAPNCASGYHCVFFLGFDSAKHSYFNSDTNFSGDTFNQGSGLSGYGQSVNDNVVSASNSSNSNYESHYYVNSNYGTFLFCVNPGSSVEYLPSSKQNQASSLQLRGRTTISCY
ncbi:hypothetical protein ABZZ74_46335 [Streptomyces sp. NPDC006476]|uniref:hypothetical protein n=1 Tax=Streptomyces sp. NPDC006476 TaxID=3157175 RepID=UPI0033B57CC8